MVPRCSPGWGLSRLASRRGSQCPRRGSTPTRHRARRDGSDSRPASLTHRRPEAAATRRPGARAAWRRPLPCRTASSRGAGPPRRPPGSAPHRRSRPPPGPAPHPAARYRLLPPPLQGRGSGRRVCTARRLRGPSGRAGAERSPWFAPNFWLRSHHRPGPAPLGRTPPHAGPGAHNECRRRGCVRWARVISPRRGQRGCAGPCQRQGQSPQEGSSLSAATLGPAATAPKPETLSIRLLTFL